MEHPLIDVPENAPEECPGTRSKDAGHATACQGCPNQQTCSTTPKGPDPALPAIQDRMMSIGHKVLILSGKGGVGKSTLTTQLACTLARCFPQKQVGVLDIDICGPSIPKMMGVEKEIVHASGSGWSPVYVDDNLCVMSIGFMLPDPDEAIIWRGPKKTGLIKQFLGGVDWGDIDYLFIDTPPGTSDEHLSITQYLRECNVDGAILITTPQEVALRDVRKEITFCQRVGLKIIGIVENMSHFVCPCCQKITHMFPPSTGGAEALCKDLGLPFLGILPLDPLIMQACENGVSLMDFLPAETSPLTQTYVRLVQDIMQKTEGITNDKETATY